MPLANIRIPIDRGHITITVSSPLGNKIYHSSSQIQCGVESPKSLEPIIRSITELAKYDIKNQQRDEMDAVNQILEK